MSLGVGHLAIKQQQINNKESDHRFRKRQTRRKFAAPSASERTAPVETATGAKDSSLDDGWMITDAQPKRPRGAAVPIEVLRINLLQLQSIDHMTQTFQARLFFQLRIPRGTLDVDLVRDLDDPSPSFPTDTLRPSASWFLQQIDFPTSLEFQILTPKVVRMQEHLDLVFKVVGTFFEEMELDCFPVDVQRLSLSLAFNCANEGVVPLAFRGSGSGSSSSPRACLSRSA